MSSVPKLLRRIAAAVLLFMALTVQHDTRTKESTVEKEIRVGVWFSPWYTSTDTTQTSSVTAPDGGSIKSETTHTATSVTMASWSWPILAAGLALLLWPTKKPLR